MLLYFAFVVLSFSRGQSFKRTIVFQQNTKFYPHLEYLFVTNEYIFVGCDFKKVYVRYITALAFAVWKCKNHKGDGPESIDAIDCSKTWILLSPYILTRIPLNTRAYHNSEKILGLWLVIDLE